MMDNLELTEMHRLCPSPEQLLTTVGDYDVETIKNLLKVYPNLDSTRILYILLNEMSDFAKRVSAETVKILIEHGADLSYCKSEDDYKEAIHFAVTYEDPSILRTIVDHIQQTRETSKLNAVTSHGMTALHLLIKEGSTEPTKFEEYMKVLLDSDIDVNVPDKNNETAIATAARKKNKLAVRLILDSGKPVDIDICNHNGESVYQLIIKNNLYYGPLRQYDSNRTDKLFSYLKVCKQDDFIKSEISNVNDDIPEGTFLQLACDRNLKGVVARLLQLGADVTRKSEKNKKTPIEIASEKGLWEIFELVLPHYTTIPDGLFNSLLPNSIQTDPTKGVEFNHEKCLKMLIESDKTLPVNNIFENGNYVLHHASKYTNSSVVLNLLGRGAKLANRNSYNLLPIGDIKPKILEQHFDSCIEAGIVFQQETSVTFNYDTLMPTVPTKTNNKANIENTCCSLLMPNEDFGREIDALVELAKIPELKHLLKHPLITNFLYLKRHELKWFLYTNITVYFIFLLSLWSHVMMYKDDAQFINSLSWHILFITWSVLLLKELLQFMISYRTYFRSSEKFLEVSLICITGYIVFASNKDGIHFKQISATAILLSALEMTLLFGQYPKFSTNIVIFRKVLLKYFKVSLVYILLMIAVVLSFLKMLTKTEYAHLKNATSEDGDKDFPTDISPFSQTVSTLAGKYDFSILGVEAFFNELFLVGLFVVPILIFNLINRLAVSDIQKIQDNAEINCYVESINYIEYIENIIFAHHYTVPTCNINNFIQDTVLKFLAPKICLFPVKYRHYKMEMFFYDDEKDKNDKKDVGSDKRLKYLDNNTVKQVKQMLSDKNHKNDEKDKTLNEQIQNLQDTLNRIKTYS